MKLISIQVGLPIEVQFKNKTVTTGIFKNQVAGAVRVGFLNLEGDGQADLRVHGGLDKAVYGYSLDAYAWWKANYSSGVFRSGVFSKGAFGENLCIDAMSEKDICIGDSFEIGSAVLQAVQPRFPCHKLGVKFQDLSILKTFTKSKRPGIYFRVLKEGVLEAGQEFKLIDRESIRFSVLDLMEAMLDAKVDHETIRQFMMVKSLPDDIRRKFQRILEKSVP